MLLSRDIQVSTIRNFGDAPDVLTDLEANLVDGLRQVADRRQPVLSLSQTARPYVLMRVDTENADQTVILPSPAVMGTGWVIVAKTGCNAVKVYPASGQINGGAFMTFCANGAYPIYCDGAAYYSTRPSSHYAEMYITSSALTSIATTQTWTKAAGTTAIDEARDFSSGGVSNRLIYNGPAKDRFRVTAALSVTAAIANKTFRFGFGVNGTIHTPSIISRWISSTDEGAVAVTAILDLSPSDYVELMIANWTDAVDATITFANVSITRAL